MDLHEAHPLLWHYTTATGLNGILKSHQLWATNFRYLNDDEELRGFFERKFPALLKTGIDKGVERVLSTARGREMLKVAGDVEGIKANFSKGLCESLTSTTLGLDVYVTSFCYPSSRRDLQNGLLSQWRGYGHDGGYAITFDTFGLNDLIHKEQTQYQHAYTSFSDVDYHHDDWMSDDNRHEETVEWERSVSDIIAKVVAEGNLEKKAEDLFAPLVAQAIRHKHYGFREECEVRLAAVRLPKRLLKEVRGMGEQGPPNKPVLFFPRSGVLVPYISFFDNIPDEERKLPIKGIVVGPHPEKQKRQRAVQMLLEEIEIDVPVTVSDIPFLGR